VLAPANGQKAGQLLQLMNSAKHSLLECVADQIMHHKINLKHIPFVEFDEGKRAEQTRQITSLTGPNLAEYGSRNVF